MGREVSVDEFADICIALQRSGASNINLVTGTHFIPSIIEGLKLARGKGLSLPVVWNSSGFEDVEALKAIAPFIDVYLPDVKTLDRGIASRFFKAPAYPEAARDAVLFMASRADLQYRGDALVRGTIVRHLVLPGFLESTREVLRFYSERLRDQALISVMVQYIPIVAGSGDVPVGKVSKAEYEELLEILDDCGIEEGFLQELSADDEWIPDFSCENPFPPEWASPVWHWKSGYCSLR